MPIFFQFLPESLDVGFIDDWAQTFIATVEASEIIRRCPDFEMFVISSLEACTPAFRTYVDVHFKRH